MNNKRPRFERLVGQRGLRPLKHQLDVRHIPVQVLEQLCPRVQRHLVLGPQRLVEEELGVEELIVVAVAQLLAADHLVKVLGVADEAARVEVGVAVGHGRVLL